MPGFHLAQINIARFMRSADDDVNADFMNALDRVNAVAEAQPGFVWRLVGEGNDATDVPVCDDPNLIANMSVWADIESLMAFVYRVTDHRDMLRRKSEWFDKLDTHLALWWIAAGHQPTVEEGLERLEMLKIKGPTADAFTFRDRFASPVASSP